MSERIYQFDPKNDTLYLGGAKVYGYGSDTKIVVSTDEDLSTSTDGVEGEITVNIKRITKGTLTVTLKAQGDWDTFLENYFFVARDLGTYTFPVLFNSKSSNKMLATEGWLQSRPEYSSGTELADREWTICIQNSVMSPIDAVSTIADVFTNSIV